MPKPFSIRDAGDPVSGVRAPKPTPRLQMVAELVPRGLRVADIGTDHGYLAVWLMRQGAESVVAADVRPGPLASARRTARAYGAADEIGFALSDGFLQLDRSALDAAVIAGMGGETIAAIAAQLTEEERRRILLILQPQSKVFALCRALEGLGYGLTGAAAAREGDRLYVAFSAAWQGGARCDLYGALRAAGTQDAADYLAARARRLERELGHLTESGRTAEAAKRRAELTAIGPTS